MAGAPHQEVDSPSGEGLTVREGVGPFPRLLPTHSSAGSVNGSEHTGAAQRHESRSKGLQLTAGRVMPGGEQGFRRHGLAMRLYAG
jgi:hypothetical protein